MSNSFIAKATNSGSVVQKFKQSSNNSGHSEYPICRRVKMLSTWEGAVEMFWGLPYVPVSAGAVGAAYLHNFHFLGLETYWFKYAKKPEAGTE